MTPVIPQAYPVGWCTAWGTPRFVRQLRMKEQAPQSSSFSLRSPLGTSGLCRLKLKPNLMKVHIHQLHQGIAHTVCLLDPALFGLKLGQMAQAESQNASNECGSETAGRVKTGVSISRVEKCVPSREASNGAENDLRH